MPTSSLHQQKSTSTHHYENHENIVLNERNQLKSASNNRKESKQNDYARIEYLKYKHEGGKPGYQYYGKHEFEHKYENLKKPVIWEAEKKGTEEGDAEEEKDNSLISIKNLENLVENNRECAFRFGYGDAGDWSKCQDVPEAPVRDPSSLKSIKYGPGHEKYPSWPGSVKHEGGEKPQRSHSWTDQTSYPKEKVTTYVRPYSMRANPAFTQQLKTVMERCEKISPETYHKTVEQMEDREGRLYLPRVDREGKSLGDQDYMVPSPPERDKPSLTQADLEKYYHENHHMTKIDNGDYSTPYEDMHKGAQLTRADLEEYVRSYDEVLKPHHQHQGSYAQSEGYHSYVSSSELTTTPFLDRLRRESDGGRGQGWEEEGRAGRDSVVTTSSGSASSSETLKWHGSMSDVSVASSSCRSRQLIAHSSRVPPPQRHHSESVLYLGNQCPGQNSSSRQTKAERSQQLKLFPVNTYTVQPNEQSKPVISPTSMPPLSVADRISELERQQQAQRFAYLDPDKRHRVSDPTLKAIQKKALLSFYERHQHSHAMGPGATVTKPKENWKSEPQLSNQNEAPPPPPPRPVDAAADQSGKRGSCASDLSVSSWGKPSHQIACSLLGPVIVGPSISVDDWVPERPPKKPHLRTVPPPIPQRTPSPVQVPPADQEVESLHAFHKFVPCYDRMPTPELPPPPPPPPPLQQEEDQSSDEPLPPPPPEIEWHLATAVPRRTSSGPASPQTPVAYSPVKDCLDSDSAERTDTLGSLLVTPGEALKSVYEIQYDQNAINAIMESNRLSKELQKKRCQSKHRDQDHEKSKSHIENRPPLPLPRDVDVFRDPLAEVGEVETGNEENDLTGSRVRPERSVREVLPEDGKRVGESEREVREERVARSREFEVPVEETGRERSRREGEPPSGGDAEERRGEAVPSAGRSKD
ncbi:UNVERIFIED_CONTAM: hypothetical protein PYX00_001249 [Menopon gallinae]|uniref:Protein Shroom n=1 Tax=Menopon gallinae TaxID=328185 RepID=A0AAW2IE36_9NEOP